MTGGTVLALLLLPLALTGAAYVGTLVLDDGRVFDDWDIQNAHEIVFEG